MTPEHVDRYITDDAVQAAQEVWDSLSPDQHFYIRDFLTAALPHIEPLIRENTIRDIVAWLHANGYAEAGDLLADGLEVTVPRCQNVSASPWGPTQCFLELGHQGVHAYSPSEAVTP